MGIQPSPVDEYYKTMSRTTPPYTAQVEGILIIFITFFCFALYGFACSLCIKIGEQQRRYLYGSAA